MRDLPVRVPAWARSRGTPGLLPRGARPGGGPHRFRAKAQAGEALDHSHGGEGAGRGRVPPDARSAGCVQAVQHVHQLHAVLLRVPHLWTRAELHRSSRHRPGPTLQHGLPGPGGGGTPGNPLRARRYLAVHLRGRVHEGVPQARGSGGRHPTVQAHRRDPLGQGTAPPGGHEMSTEPHYTLYHPRWYRRRVSVWWWLQNRSYTAFVLRELTSVFVAFFAVVYLWQLRALAQGPRPMRSFSPG